MLLFIPRHSQWDIPPLSIARDVRAVLVGQRTFRDRHKVSQKSDHLLKIVFRDRMRLRWSKRDSSGSVDNVTAKLDVLI